MNHYNTMPLNIVESPIELLRQLVAIPSVNPMGGEHVEDYYYEEQLATALWQALRDVGIACQMLSFAPHRNSVIAYIPGDSGWPTILFDAHLDTVPVVGMTIPPFEPKLVEGKMYGRGTCDVKGGLAAMLAAFLRIHREQPHPRCSLLLSCCSDEEFTGRGIAQLCELWAQPVTSSFFRRPDMAIVAEPTLLDLVVAHRGVMRWHLETSGRACHSSRPHDGINAIYRMGKVLTALERYAHQIQHFISHHLCGPATLSVGKIRGGSSVNVVPDHCVIELERRLIPGEDPQAVFSMIQEYLQKELPFPVHHHTPYLVSHALNDDYNRETAARIMEIVRSQRQDAKTIGVPYGTHASRLQQAGIPAVVFGPGDIAQAHTEDEWIELAQVMQAAEIYYRIATHYHCP